ncbi:hypothetical protein BMG_5912 (plasmid) [Priestia megaterium]|nr:hypothetical protein BMG_5912 [Priestia megaterium]
MMGIEGFTKLHMVLLRNKLDNKNKTTLNNIVNSAISIDVDK